MLSIKTAFNKFYGQILTQYGFHKIKGMPCFGRLINNEIFQYIMPKTVSTLIKGKKAFTIISGMFSIYSHIPCYDRIDFENMGQNFISFCNVNDTVKDRFNELYQFHYDDSDIHLMLEKTFFEFQNIMLPYLDSVQNIKDYVQYLKDFQPGRLRFADNMKNEGIILVKINDHDDFMKYYQQMCDTMLKHFDNNPNNPHYIESINLYHNTFVNEIACSRDNIYNSAELYEQAMNELEKRKEKNISFLKANGFI